MNYEQKYKEALERANEAVKRGMVSQNFVDDISGVESEDERIRKHIIKILDSLAPCHWDGNEKAKCIAYLENLKEQKPAEWSEDIIRKAVKEVGLTQHQIDWFKTNVFQPKQEWSEEDKGLLERAISIIGWAGSCTDKYKIINPDGAAELQKFLKSLRHQPKQLKEEYKEGFQTARHATALAFMKYCDKIRPNAKMCLSNGECEEIEKAFLVGDWEKIERYFHKYSWKPSEEQMNSLGTVVKGAGKNSVGSVSYNLKELYEQLKAL